MSRPPLPVGSHGNINTKPIGPKLWLAQCRHRDADGETRQVKRTGKSQNAAENALRKALTERRHTAGATLTPDSRIREAAVLWFEQREAELAAGDLAHNTLGAYRSAWRLHIEPALGGLRLREVNVSRCEAWQQALRRRKGASTTKSSRAVLSGILGYAARMGAIQTNPCRDMSKIPGKRKRQPRAMTKVERNEWLDKMTADAKAARWEIPDLTRFMLSTGCRIGEALAVSWDEVDLDAGTVAICWHLVRVTGEGLLRMPGAKSDAGDRLLKLPRWAVDVLMHRRVAEDSGYPVFPDSLGGWRDPSNTMRVLRESRDAAGFEWVTSHVFRQTVITVLDEADLPTRHVADQAGHSQMATTQLYMARKVASDRAAEALEDLL